LKSNQDRFRERIYEMNYKDKIHLKSKKHLINRANGKSKFNIKLIEKIDD